jgi:hypothetical protein
LIVTVIGTFFATFIGTLISTLIHGGGLPRPAPHKPLGRERAHRTDWLCTI